MKRARAATMFVVAAWAVSLQGCFESLPLSQGVAPSAGRVELVLNDQGRAALSERLGPQVEKLEGAMLSQAPDSYTMSVARISQLNGNTAMWNGEQVTVRKDHTVGYQVRQLNKVRTIGLAVALTAVVVFLFNKSLFTAQGTDDKPAGPAGGEPTRVVR
ncbi:MAG: hypothetical protein NTX19_08475 [Gemmatimonadetes bacterium]|nr:hypothetical protein [Gemmatimonadota bacterium]